MRCMKAFYLHILSTVVWTVQAGYGDPEAGCKHFDKSLFQVGIEPADGAKADLARLTDGGGVVLNFRYHDLNITIDLGRVYYPWENSVVWTSQFWYLTRIQEWRAYSSEDGVTWNYHGSSKVGGGSNVRRVLPAIDSPVRYGRMEYVGGKYNNGPSWGMREFIASDCGPMYTTTNTTTLTRSTTTVTFTTTTTTASSSTWTSSSTSSSSTISSSTSSSSTISSSTSSSTSSSSTISSSSTTSSSSSSSSATSATTTSSSSSSVTSSSTSSVTSTTSSTSVTFSTTSTTSATTSSSTSLTSTSSSSTSLTSTSATSTTSSSSSTFSSSSTTSRSGTSTTTTSSSSSSSSSSTSSSSRTTVTTTTTTTAKAESPEQAQEQIGKALEGAAEKFLQSFRASSGNETVLRDRIPGGELVAVKLSAAAAGNASAVARLEEVEVSLPASFLAKLFAEDADAALVVAAFDEETARLLAGESRSEDGRELRTEVRALVSVEIASFSRGKLNVSGLLEPIALALPVVPSPGLLCAYWDEELKDWSTEGVETSVAEEKVTCLSTHLSLFGAIVQGFMSTLECSQVKLLNAEAIGKIPEGDWPWGSGALVLWTMLALLLGIFLTAARKDTHHSWGNDFFLIEKNNSNEQLQKIEEEAVAAQLSEFEPNDSQPAQGPLMNFCCCIVGLCVACCQLVKQSSALRDVIDEVMSSWFEYFSDCRSLCEELCSSLEVGGSSGDSFFHALNFRVTSHLLNGSIRRVAGASMGISDALVNFIMQDEDLRTFLIEEHEENLAKKSKGRAKGSMRVVAEKRAAELKIRVREAKRARQLEQQFYSSASSSTTAGQTEDSAEHRIQLVRPPSKDRPPSKEHPRPLRSALASPTKGDQDLEEGQVRRKPKRKVTFETGEFDKDQLQEDDDEDEERITFEAEADDVDEGVGVTSTPSTQRERRPSIFSEMIGQLSVGPEVSLGPLSKGVHWKKTLNKREAWAILHHEVSERMHSMGTLYSKPWGLSHMIWRIFLVQNPLTSALFFNPLMSSKMQALFITLDVMGTITLSATFFQATGSIKGKTALGGSSCAGAGPLSGSLAFQLGRLLAIAVGSVLIAGLPVGLLASLHTRSFRFVDRKDSKQWKGYLRAWRIQDGIIWVVGSLYLGFCVFFILIFLANIDAEDQENFSKGIAIALLQIFLITPVVVACTIPSLSWIALHINHRAGWFDRAHLLRQAHVRSHQRSNLTLPIVYM